MELLKPFQLSHSDLSPQINSELIEKLVTAKIDESVNFIGQQRAQTALEFGLNMEMAGYNVFVMGEPATGRHTLIDNYLQEVAKSGPTPYEWGYINNFEDTRSPNFIRLPAGDSKPFVAKMNAFIDEVLDTFPAAFDNPAYQRKKRAVEREFNRKYELAIEKVETRALENSLVLYEEQGAVSFAPVVDGKPVADNDFAQLSDEQRQQFYDKIAELEIFLNETLIELPQWKRESSENQRELLKQTIETALRPLFKDIEHEYAAQIGIVKFVAEMKETVVTLVQDWLSDEADDDKSNEDVDVRQIFEDQLLPNILQHRDVNDGAPIVYEANPSFQNLFGKVEYSSVQGSVYTSYRMIRAGALHKANGGYLLIEADKLLQQPSVWEALKLSLKSMQVRMETPVNEASVVNAASLSPQPMPLDVKVILMGSRDLYYLIQEYDNEFNELFRVLADFEHFIPLNDKVLYGFVQKIKQFCEKESITLTAKAVEQLLNFSYRQAAHKDKLSARFADVLELIGEARFYANKQQHSTIDQQHVQQALNGKQQRTGQISESFLEDIQEGQILIDSDGYQVGKVNGLTVLEIGDTVFGTPARISATVYAGSNGVVDIEREVELGKAIHSKGVMLLNGYLGHKYAQDFSLCFSANIAIEQSYGHIDGDSASLAEACTLISAITQVPLNQAIAITGSINQHGQVQSVGGVNEKIEGFFKLCKARKLTSGQGVIIPKTNCINLVLSEEVISAVQAGQFHIYAVSKVDDALTILTGKPAGEMSARGRYPRDSVNHLAGQRLRQIADIVAGEVE